jgi:hypothetical protein
MALRVLSKVIIKYKDGDVFMHKLSGKEVHDIHIISELIRNASLGYDDEENENANIHSVEIILA